MTGEGSTGAEARGRDRTTLIRKASSTQSHLMAPDLLSPAARLRKLLHDTNQTGCLLMPACHDALSAKLIAEAGFKVAFMSGYAVSAAQIAQPDVGLISYGEVLKTGQDICNATRASQLCVGCR